jgi:hypothetical protein
VTDDLKSPFEVLEAYIEHRSRWIQYASKGETPPDDVMPVEVTPTSDLAKELQGRLSTLQEHILPFFRKE